MKELRVRDCMTRNPVTIPGVCTLYEAYRLMMERKIRRLLVVDERSVAGLVTLEDLRRHIPVGVEGIDLPRTREVFSKTTVSDIMSKNLQTIQVDATLIQAAQRMLEFNISTLPVMSGKRLVGIITESDIFKAMVKAIVISSA